MNKKILIVGGLLGMLSVILGAYAAHGLEKIADAQGVANFKTGVQYQMYHALFLLFVGNSTYLSAGKKQVILVLTVLGVLLFSGSIYGLATNAHMPFDFKKIGFITPIGGVFLIAAWVFMLINFIKLRPNINE